jgi:hypothetical protein
LINILCYFYLVNLRYYHLFCPTGRGFTSVLSAAFSYGNLGRVSPPRSDKHPSSSALSKSRSSPSCCYSIWLLPSAVIVTFSWTRMIWKNLHVGQKRWVNAVLISFLNTGSLLATPELLGQYEIICTWTRRWLNIATTDFITELKNQPTVYKIYNP